MRKRLALLLALLLGLLPPGFAQAEAPLPVASADAAAHQLLVMLHLPRPHYRPDGGYAGSYGDGVGAQARQRLARALAQLHGLDLEDEWPMPLAGVDCYVMRLPVADARTPEDVARVLAQDERVAWAQAMHLYRAQAQHRDPLYAAQPAAQQWQLGELHELATGRGVRVAVIDSSIDAAHPDLAGQLLLNENHVDARPLPAESHGTAVAGIIAARADNGLGIVGIAPRAQLLGLRACWQASAADTLCTSLSLAKALHAAVLHGAHIINMSLSGPADRLLGVLVDQALARGMAVVAAQGTGPANFPANHPGVLAVSDAPPLPPGGLLAPGRDVPSTAPAGAWALVTGSSFAAAHVAGLLALLRELDGADLVRASLVTAPAGRIDACASLLQRTSGNRRVCAAPALGHTPG